ncbi:MAG: desulfoferrodoxin [Chitinivibrionales bacterium]|nr:desulfoferrodoxin [Chitinivibrionales bacterium]MBD3358948.1 desulfoferrodoxin [Chitinivibrionales bacterium]
MSVKKAVYRCEVCANVIEELWDGRPEPECCGQTMTKLEPNKTDAATEKHVPVIERDGNRVTVKVGEAPHPMTKEHYILFVEVMAGDKVYRHDFKEGDEKAEAEFLIEAQDIAARAFCNLHSFWSSK